MKSTYYKFLNAAAKWDRVEGGKSTLSLMLFAKHFRLLPNLEQQSSLSSLFFTVTEFIPPSRKHPNEITSDPILVIVILNCIGEELPV